MRRSDQLPSLLPWSESVIRPATTGTMISLRIVWLVAASVLTPEIIINPYKIIEEEKRQIYGQAIVDSVNMSFRDENNLYILKDKQIFLLSRSINCFTVI